MFLKRLDELRAHVAECTYTLAGKTIAADEALEWICFLLEQVQQVRGIVYVVGNGGSAGIASHFATDLLRTLEMGASTLTDSSSITCFSNDFGYEEGFRMQLKRKLRPEDMLVAISSSGKSPNILNAAEVAIERRVPVLTLSGFGSDNPLREMGDLNLWLDSTDYGIVESGHFFLLHTVIDEYSSICSKKLNSLKRSTLSLERLAAKG